MRVKIAKDNELGRLFLIEPHARHVLPNTRSAAWNQATCKGYSDVLQMKPGADIETMLQHAVAESL